MHFKNILLRSVSLATAQGYVAPRNIGSSGSLLSFLKLRRSSSGASSCQKDDCYNAIFSRKDNGFCRQFNSPSSCNLPSDLRKYSSKKDSVHSACNCFLQQSPSTSSAPATSPASGPSSCVKDSCYNDIFNRNDNGFCRQFNSPSSCNLPSDLSKYSSEKDSVRSACNCYLQHQSTQTSGPPTNTHPITTNCPSQPGHTVTITGPESDYTVTVSQSRPVHTVTVSGSSQPAHTVTVSGPSQPAHTVTVSGASQQAHTVTVSGASQPVHTMTVSGPSQPAHTVTVSGASQLAHIITVSAPTTKTCPSASTVKETCTVTKTLTPTAQATCPSHSASVITKTCTVTKTATCNGLSSTIRVSTTQK